MSTVRSLPGRGSMGRGLSIGEFARLTRLSVRTLRRYHDGEQIPVAQVIHRLRELDVPLADVRRILGADDPAVRAELLAGHLRRVGGELGRTRAAAASPPPLLAPGTQP